MAIIGCPLCGRKHEEGFCIVTGKQIDENETLIEFGDDEEDSDYGFEGED